MLTLRPATLADAERLFAWRNDPATRAASVHDGEVAWEEHLAWLNSSLASLARDLLIAEEDGEPVGTVRIDRTDETEVSWTVAPGHRGKGYGAAMVRLACPDEPSIAHIKADNAASRKIAVAAGYSCIEKGPLERWTRDGSKPKA